MKAPSWIPFRPGRRPATSQAAPAGSIVETFWSRVAERTGDPALRWRDGQRWQTLSWTGYGDAVRRVAARLLELGIEPGDRVGILSNNRWEWHVTDLAVMSVGGVTVPVYQTNAAGQVARALSHCGARLCFVDGPDQLAKILIRREEMPNLEHVCLFDDVVGLDHDFILDASEWFDRSAPPVPPTSPTADAIDARISAIMPEDLATLVYTSGTTGPPKGTMLTHGNITATLRNVTSVVSIGSGDRFLSFLPLSHIAERAVSHFGQITSGGQTWFAQSLASVPDDLGACRPTIFFAVPRVWEKLQEGVVHGLSELPGPMRALAGRYLEVARQRQASSDRPLSQRVVAEAEFRALDAVLGRQIRSNMGLTDAHFLVSGAAPIALELLEWFRAIGMPIAEVYGQTEGCGVTTLNPPGAIRPGTVGPPVPNVELRIAEDGEVLARGDCVTPGYLHDPEATGELLDEEGWMHTGDVGALDAAGYLTITGRKKDLIVTSSGKNISPQEIETALRYEPLISQAIVVGDTRPYLGALLTLDPDALAGWAQSHGKFAQLEDLLEDADLVEDLRASIARVNAKHARIEGIKRWRVLPRDLTVAEGELTPTLKVKREAVSKQFQGLIDEMYADV